MNALMIAATLMLAGTPAKTAGMKSNLVLSTDGPKLRVTIDGQAYGKYTAKSLTVSDIAPGKHDVEISWLDGGLTRAPSKKTVYTGKLMVDSGKEMRIRVVPTGIQITDEVELAQDAAPQVVGAPVKDFANAPSILHIQSEKFMAMVMIDGTPLQQGDCSSPKACTVTDITPGQHDVEVRGGAFGTKPIFKGLVQVTGGAEVFAKTADNKFQIYNTQARVFPQDTVVATVPPQMIETTTTTTTVDGDAGGAGVQMSFVDPDTGEMVHMGVSAGPTGGSSTITTHQTTTTTTGMSNTQAVMVHQGPGSLELASQDGESFIIFIDGKKMGQFIGISGQSLKLKNIPAGEHKLQIKSFPLADEVLASGRLYMDPGFDLKMGFGENEGLEAYNRPNAYDSGN